LKPFDRSWPRENRPPELEPILVIGDDAELGRAVTRAPGGIYLFQPDRSSDLARNLGIRSTVGENKSSSADSKALSMDALLISDDTSPTKNLTAVNMIISGTAPDRLRWWSRSRPVTVTIDGKEIYAGHAAGVAIATGQFMRGLDLFPRGHPGDGKIEVQIIHIRRSQRRKLRTRLAAGTHVPHPEILERSGREVVVAWAQPNRQEIDGQTRKSAAIVAINVWPEAYWIVAGS